MTNNESDNEFDIREQVTPEQMQAEEEKAEDDQKKVIEHIKNRQKELNEQEESSKNVTKQELEKEFDKYKKNFSNLIKELTLIHEQIDHTTVEIEVALRKGDTKTIENQNEVLKEKRVILRSQVNDLNNNIYNNTTTLISKLLVLS